MNDSGFLNSRSEADILDFLNQDNSKKSNLQKFLSSQIFLNYLRIAVRLFSLLISTLGLWFIVKNEIQDSNCWANKGSLTPFRFDHRHDNRIYTGYNEEIDWFPFINTN